MKELLIALDSKSKIPLYEQIYQFIKSEIQIRQMLPGERLPSTRALAQNLQISRSTAELAYDQLLSEGYIESLPYKGYYVCELEGLYDIRMNKNPQDNSKHVKQEAFRYDFAVNGIDAQGFPHNIWQKLTKEVLQEEYGQLLQLGDPQGELSLREAIADYLHHARGVSCSPEQIVLGAGNDYLLMLLQLLLRPNCVIGMENPTYKSAYIVFRNLGYKVAEIAMDQHGMRAESLAAAGADIAYVMPAHQFPMGIVMPVKRRLQLLNWAAEAEGRYIIEDDYDSEFRYRGKPIPALQGYDRHETVIYMGTFSKSIAPAIRISYMVLPENLLAVYQRKGSAFSSTVSRVDQKVLEIFLRDGHYERHLNRMRIRYRAKRDVFLEEIKHFSDICTVAGEDAGLHVVISFTNGLTEQKAVKSAGRNGIKVYGLTEYSITAEYSANSQCIIMGYATMSEQEIASGLRKLHKVWNV